MVAADGVVMGDRRAGRADRRARRVLGGLPLRVLGAALLAGEEREVEAGVGGGRAG